MQKTLAGESTIRISLHLLGSPDPSPESKAAVPDRVFEELPRTQVAHIKIEAVSLDSTSTKVHADGAS